MSSVSEIQREVFAKLRIEEQRFAVRPLTDEDDRDLYVLAGEIAGKRYLQQQSAHRG